MGHSRLLKMAPYPYDVDHIRLLISVQVQLYHLQVI